MIYGDPILLGGGGGGGDVIAFIVTTYPAGSVCTASDGSKTLTAGDTSGSWVFKIPSAGSWVVTATDGSDSASATIVISTEGQSESVALIYSLYLFKSGTGQVTPMTLTPERNATINETTDSIVISWSSQSNARASVCTTSPVDVTDFDKLYITLDITQKYNYGPTFGLANDPIVVTSSLSSFAVSAGTLAVTSGVVTLELDISGYTGEYYVAYWGTAKCTIYNFWLE